MALKRPAKKSSQKPTTKRTAKRTAAKRVAPKKQVPARSAAPREERVHGRRADLGSDVEPLVAALPKPTRDIVNALRAIIRKAAPGATETVKWGMPVYSHQGLLCYITTRTKRVRFGFYQQGIQLTDPDGLLEGSGDNMRHIKLDSLSDIRPAVFSRWVKEAVRINSGGKD